MSHPVKVVYRDVKTVSVTVSDEVYDVLKERT